MSYSDAHLKPDKTVHKKGQNEGTEGCSKCKLPGQIAVPKRYHNESDFVGEKGSSGKKGMK